MEITTIIHTHGNPDVTWDTVDSVRTYMTDQILVLVDGAGWDKFDLSSAKANMLEGFRHGYPKAPYRNIAMGLLAAAKNWPDSDWYAYLEYDALVGSSAFKNDLAAAAKDGVWLLGNDYRDKQTSSLSFAELMLKTKFEEVVYLLGAVLFYHKDFIKKCMEENFFEKLLYYTNDFKNDFFPGYDAWDVMEHLMPTLAKHWGGGVTQFAKWISSSEIWAGNYRRYPIRWQPDLSLIDYEYLQASILHPLKKYDHPVRKFHREKRIRRK